MKARRPRLWWRLLRVLLLIYLVWCALLYFAQDTMVFPVGQAGTARPVPQAAILIEREIGESKVPAWLMLAPGASAQSPAPLVLFFHGNAELIDGQRDIVSAYHARGYSVLLPEYRGYGHAAGTPTQKNIVADAVWFYDQLSRRGDVDGKRIIFHGRSIGGAIAAQVATQRKPAALILQSTPANVASMAWQFGVPPLLVSNPFETDEALAKLDIPILLFHGTIDEIIPIHDARKLKQAAPHATLIELHADHNNFPGTSENEASYWRAIDDLLEQLATASEGRIADLP